MNADKITRAPWTIRHGEGVGRTSGCESGPNAQGGYRCVFVGARELKDADAEFIALARQAFDVQMRLGWWTVPGMDGNGVMAWKVEAMDDLSDRVLEGKWWPDPFTALTEAEKLCGENVD